jgi:hypothetical protein
MTPPVLKVDLLETENAIRLEAAFPLAIKLAAWPRDKHKPIPHKPMIAKDKLAVEGG